MDLFYVRIATHTGQIELILTWMTWSNRVNREKQNCFTKQCYKPSFYRHQGVVSGWWARSHKCCIQIMCFLPQQRILPWGAPIGLCVVVMMRFNLLAYELLILKKKQIPNFLIHVCRVSKFFQFLNLISHKELWEILYTPILFSTNFFLSTVKIQTNKKLSKTKALI